MKSNWSYSLETLNSGQNWRYFVPCNLEIWRMTLQNNWAPLLCCFKLCASFHSHHWIQARVTFRKLPILGQNWQFFVPCDLEFDWWPLVTIGHVFYAARVSLHSHHWIQTGVTVRKRPIRVQIGDFFPCDMEIWRMTLKNNKAPLVCCFKLCASFHSHQ